MAYKLVKTEGGKTNWGYLRHIFYTGLIVWAVGVRLIGADPFDDLLAMELDLGTALDVLFLWALWMVVWFVFYPIRPRFNTTA